MAATKDEDTLAEVSKLLESGRGTRNSRLLNRTLLTFIVPAGRSSAYSLDDLGNVNGFKFGSPPKPQQLIELLMKFAFLERLVFHSGDERVRIPPSIGSLSHLRFVSFDGNFISLPPELLEINLPFIVVGKGSEDGEALESFTREFTHMTQVLDRRDTGDKQDADRDEVRDELSLLARLTDQEVAHLQSLSDQVTGIFIKSSNLQDPPIEIVARGRDSIASYFREKERGALNLNEVKVLLVGNGSSGKTSVMKRLNGNTFDPNESQTHGINIRSITMGTKKQGKLRANFWDFGGQEIMHATHQFFLSKRSLYILVLDGRKEEDPEYWLQHIQSFGGESPVLVLLNKIDEHPSFDVNRRFLTTKYPSICGFFQISCANGFGIPAFRKALQRQLQSAVILRTVWPKSWVRVKQHLKIIKSHYISVAEYNAICDAENVADQTSRDALVEFLHDLGVVLHFKDLQLLDTHVLDPRWVTEGAYRIINSPLLARQKGLLQLSQLNEIFSASRGQGEFEFSPDKYGYIVELMLKFELCYRVNSSSILIPDLLDIQEPELDRLEGPALTFVFEYQYLPKSIMPRFIVRMHTDVSSQGSWRTGIVLKDTNSGATAVVRADEKARRIYVAVSGNQKRDYFAVIRRVIFDINTAFEKLMVTEFVPLPDTPDILLEYAELIGHETAKKSEIFVGKLGKAFSVKMLLNGIEDEESRLQHTPYTVINVHGAYVNQSTTSHGATTNIINSIEGGPSMVYQAATWEKVISYVTACGFVATILFLAIRNQPIVDLNVVIFLRVLLSLMVAIFGGSVPGMLHVNLTTKKGLAIRASGALALFVISFFETPKVLSHH